MQSSTAIKRLFAFAQYKRTRVHRHVSIAAGTVAEERRCAMTDRNRTVIVQKWEESERGWGTRPDGYSLHLSEADRRAYIAEYWARMPDEPPDEYSRPDGTPYEATVDNVTFARLRASKNGIRSFDRTYAGSGGVDGWRPARIVP